MPEPSADPPYEPISCSAHDRLLAAATLRQESELEVEGSEGEREIVRGVIRDVFSRAGAEYLELADGRLFRLDRIRSLNGQW